MIFFTLQNKYCHINYRTRCYYFYSPPSSKKIYALFHLKNFSYCNAVQNTITAPQKYFTFFLSKNTNIMIIRRNNIFIGYRVASPKYLFLNNQHIQQQKNCVQTTQLYIVTTKLQVIELSNRLQFMRLNVVSLPHLKSSNINCITYMI